MQVNKKHISQLVIFDCDGVLVDSEILAHRVYAREMPKFGFPLTVEKSIELFSGTPNSEVANILHKEYGRRISDKDLKKIFQRFVAAFATDLQVIPNISQVINFIEQKQIAKCIASNGLHPNITKSLALTGLIPYFKTEDIFSVTIVKKGKPSPDLFLHAAETFKVHPHNCVVIEDSLLGIAAAHAAKMAVIGFLGGTHAQNSWYAARIAQAKPSMLATDANELLQCLRSRLAL